MNISSMPDLVPLFVMVLKVALGVAAAVMVVAWRITSRARRKAYGPGGGRR